MPVQTCLGSDPCSAVTAAALLVGCGMSSAFLALLAVVMAAAALAKKARVRRETQKSPRGQK